jgi:hypothetical protein
VEAEGVILIEVFSPIATQNLHSESPWYYLPFVTVLETIKLGFVAGVVVKLPPLCLSAITAHVYDGTARTQT